VARSPDAQTALPPFERSRALVTGGARGLGRACALALARDGFDVGITYFRSEERAQQTVRELREGEGHAEAFCADLRSASTAAELVEAVEAGFGPIDLLVNNAGVLLAADLESADLESFDHSIDLNLRAPYLLGLQWGRRMKERGGGSIVNLASVGGTVPYLRYIPYSVSKAGLLMLTRVLALALAPEVRVNAIAPGAIALEESSDHSTLPPLRSIPLARYGAEEDVEQALLFLASSSCFKPRRSLLAFTSSG